MSNPTLYVLSGPTASGKTELAIQWAEDNDAEILSCDTLLVYKGMDIGTAKPTKEQQIQIKHHLIDCVEVGFQFCIKDYIQRAKLAIESILAKDKKVLIVGGSGFYLKAFFEPVADSVEVDFLIRTEIQNRLMIKGLQGLVEDLKAINPLGLGNLDVQNPRRVTRAFERCISSGKQIVQLEADFKEQKCEFEKFDKKLFILDRMDVDLKQRIRKRVETMVEVGLLDEVKELMDKGILNNPSACMAIGYREVIDWIKQGKKEPISALKERIITHTWHLVRKQKTWLRNQRFVSMYLIQKWPEFL